MVEQKGEQGNTKRHRSKFPEEDRAMIRAAQSGDRQAMLKVIERYKHIARSFAYGFVNNKNYSKADCEDMYQDGIISIMKAVKIYGRYTDDNNEPYPFHKTIWLLIRSDAQVKGKKRIATSEREVYTPEGEIFYTADQAQNMEEEDKVEKQQLYTKAWEYAREALNPKQWIVWRLYYGRDMREVDIARELNISRQAVNVRLQKARKNVRKAFIYEGYRIDVKKY